MKRNKSQKGSKKLGLEGEVLRRLSARPLTQEELKQVNGGDDMNIFSCWIRVCTYSMSSM